MKARSANLEPPETRPGPPPARPGQKKRRVVYKVERLAEELRALVDRGLAQGKSFRQISQEVTAAGERVSETAVARYWRYRWLEQSRRVQTVSEKAEALALALRRTGESDEAVLARKMLLAQVLDRMADLEEMDIEDLLAQSREMVKATKHLAASQKGEKGGAAQLPLTAAERRRRVREIYGWPEEKLDTQTKADT